MDSKHIKVDKNQQTEKKKITHSVLHVSHYGTLPSSAWFCLVLPRRLTHISIYEICYHARPRKPAAVIMFTDHALTCLKCLHKEIVPETFAQHGRDKSESVATPNL